MRKREIIKVGDYDRYVIRKGRLFLMGTHKERGKKVPTWTQYKYDAWRTRHEQNARLLVTVVGGKVAGFNPMTGDVREV